MSIEILGKSKNLGFQKFQSRRLKKISIYKKNFIILKDLRFQKFSISVTLIVRMQFIYWPFKKLIDRNYMYFPRENFQVNI